MNRPKKASVIVQKTELVDRYLFTSSDTVYQVRSTPEGLLAKREVQDNLLFTGEVIQRSWFKITKEYINSLIEFGLAKKI